MRKTKYAVELTEAEQARLRTFVGAGIALARRLTRTHILLEANQGAGGAAWRDAAIAGALEVHPTTVARTRRQFGEQGVDATLERKCPDRVYERSLDGTAETHLVALACAAAPGAVSGDAAAAGRRIGPPGGGEGRLVRGSAADITASALKPWLVAERTMVHSARGQL